VIVYRILLVRDGLVLAREENQRTNDNSTYDFSSKGSHGLALKNKNTKWPI
jgi:hypothetical protein